MVLAGTLEKSDHLMQEFLHANKRVDFKGIRVTVVEMSNMLFNCRHNILLTKEGRPYGPMGAVKPLIWLHLKEHFIIF